MSPFTHRQPRNKLNRAEARSSMEVENAQFSCAQLRESISSVSYQSEKLCFRNRDSHSAHLVKSSIMCITPNYI